MNPRSFLSNFWGSLHSLERHEKIQKWNDYLGLITGCLSIITALFSFVNLFVGLIDKITAFVPAFLLVILFIAIQYFCKSK
jgi:hypothetical protein